MYGIAFFDFCLLHSPYDNAMNLNTLHVSLFSFSFFSSVIPSLFFSTIIFQLLGAKVAIKTYDKSKLKDPAHWKRVHSEIKIMEQLSHPRIARMYEAVETTKRMHLIMECLDGSNLCSYVKSKKRLSEEEASRIFFQILQAVDHLHSLGVSHRDIKLENVLFVHPTDSLDIKLIDFGFSTVCQVGRKLKIFCGTPSCKYAQHVHGSNNPSHDCSQ